MARRNYTREERRYRRRLRRADVGFLLAALLLLALLVGLTGPEETLPGERVRLDVARNLAERSIYALWA